MARRIAAVMSTYQPDDSVVAHVLTAAQQVDRLFVIDDTGGASRLAADLPMNVSVIPNGQNLGLATSLNRGVRAALEWGATHILTLDDDTRLPATYVARLAEALDAARAEGVPVLTAGPRTVNGSLAAYGELHRAHGAECSLYVMQSGLLFDAEAFAVAGFFRDEFFIDAIEPDFLARMHRRGFHTLLVPGLDLPHSVGEPRVIDLGFRTVTTHRHSAFRMFYFTRNTLTFVRENRDIPVLTRRRRALLRREIVKTLVFEPGRVENLRAVWHGFWAYRTGNLGGSRPPS